jgi:hypothetical protein
MYAHSADGFSAGAMANGPRERVDGAFQAICLDSPSFPALARARPEVALEVLLAVCIEEPQHENPFGYSHREDCGVEHWHGGYPPLYFRGPFLLFLREAPEQGLSFVLRRVNFASRRYAETEPQRLARLGIAQGAEMGVTVTVEGNPVSGSATPVRFAGTMTGRIMRKLSPVRSWPSRSGCMSNSTRV